VRPVWRLIRPASIDRAVLLGSVPERSTRLQARNSRGKVVADAENISLTVENSSIKTRPQSRYLDETEEPRLSWVCVNEVTWKLTDGVMLREPVSDLLGSVSSSRALAWLMCNFMRDGHSTWFARFRRGLTFGPVTIGAAKLAAEHMLKFGVFPEREPA
jgi:hypothetical protein